MEQVVFKNIEEADFYGLDGRRIYGVVDSKRNYLYIKPIELVDHEIVVAKCLSKKVFASDMRYKVDYGKA